MKSHHRNLILITLPLVVFMIAIYYLKQHITKKSSAEDSLLPPKLKYVSGIRSILEDSKGNWWFGSQREGVALLTGTKLSYFTSEDGLSDNQIRSIYEDSKGDIWFETARGISSFDGKKISIQTDKNYNSKNAWGYSENDLWFKSDEVNGHNEQEGQPGVYRYDGQTFSYHVFPVKPIKTQKFPYSVSTPFIKGKNNKFWFATYGAVIAYDGSSFKILDNRSLVLNRNTGLLHVRSIFEDSKGKLWIGNNGIGVLVHDGKRTINFTKRHKLNTKNNEGNSLENVFSIAEDKQGNMWFGTFKSGVWRYDGKSFANFTAKDGIPNEQITTIYKSKDQKLWFGGTNPSGVYQFNGVSFEKVY